MERSGVGNRMNAHAHQRPAPRSRASGFGAARSLQITGRRSGCTIPRAASWRITGDHSPGDADYYKLTNQLSDQLEWFMPSERPAEEDDDNFGLTQTELAALGLVGPGRRFPDSVRTVDSFDPMANL
jgi:hypothetical protein